MEKFVGRIRGLITPSYAEGREEEQLHITQNGDALVANALPELAEIVRLGDSWQLLTAAFTGLAVLPTTVAIARIWNGEPDNGKIYAIDSVSIFRPIIDVTTDDQFTVFAQVSRRPVAAITDSGLAKVSLSGKPNYGGRARHDTNVAASAETGRWTVIGNSPPNATAIAGTAWTCVDIPLRGQCIVPPGASFGIHVVEVTATASAFRGAIRWHEVQIANAP